ncbi:uncharacterized protein LOC141905035 [Tubulanus polymorphus]|uniref:uncharacterized protein LOC141905035 n=1 Tax=Tubulanus polymorphus TaxID=672921 RepID=UPI003DA51C99
MDQKRSLLIVATFVVFCYNYGEATENTICSEVELPTIVRLEVSRFEVGSGASIIVDLNIQRGGDVKVKWFRQQEETSYLVADTVNTQSFEIIRGGNRRARLHVNSVKYRDLKETHILEIAPRSSCADVSTRIIIVHKQTYVSNIRLPTIKDVSGKFVLSENVDKSWRLSATVVVHGVEKYLGRYSRPPRIGANSWRKIINRDASPVNRRHFEPNGAKYKHTKAEEWISESSYQIWRILDVTNATWNEAGMYSFEFNHGFTGGFRYTVRVFSEIELPTYPGILHGMYVQSCSGHVPHIDGSLPIRKNYDDCIMCRISGYPRPYIRWSRHSTQTGVYRPFAASDVSTPGHSYRTDTQYIQGDTRYMGRYKCEAGYNKPILSVTYKVAIFEPIKFLFSSSSSVILLGQSQIQFVCNASGDPLPNISFYKGPTFSELPVDHTTKLPWLRVVPFATRVSIQIRKDRRTMTSVGIMTLNYPGDEVVGRGQWDYKCVASNHYDRKFRTMSIQADF